MRVGESIRKSIDDWLQNEPEASMLHACNAVDGTARAAFPALGSNARFTRLLRENYFILGPMGLPGINLEETRFPVRVQKPKSPDGRPDIADVIYGIHRCCHGHGEALPDGFELLADAAGPPRVTRISMRLLDRTIQLSDRVIFGLIAVAVLSPHNRGESIDDGYYLTFGSSQQLTINEWWGRAADFPAVAATDPCPSVRMVFPDNLYG